MSAKEKIEQALAQVVAEKYPECDRISEDSLRLTENGIAELEDHFKPLLPEYEAEIRRECYERAANVVHHELIGRMPVKWRDDLSREIRALAEGETEHGR